MVNAIADLYSVLGTISGLVVQTQLKTAGSSGFTLSVVNGALENEYLIGAQKQIQQLELVLETKGTSNDPATVYAMNRSIKDAIELDRRRGGYAETTIVGDWTPAQDDGREGLIQSLPVEIQVYES